jgi:hypothetical protein
VIVLDHIKILHSKFLNSAEDCNFIQLFREHLNLGNFSTAYNRQDSVIFKLLLNALHLMRVKEIALQLCTCTWLEIMTCIGITLYLINNSEYNLALITMGVFSPLIGFHFAISKTSNDDHCDTCRESKPNLSKFHIHNSHNQ